MGMSCGGCFVIRQMAVILAMKMQCFVNPVVKYDVTFL